MGSRYFVRAADIPDYHPANHTGTSNKRLQRSRPGTGHLFAPYEEDPARVIRGGDHQQTEARQ